MFDDSLHLLSHSRCSTGTNSRDDVRQTISYILDVFPAINLLCDVREFKNANPLYDWSTRQVGCIDWDFVSDTVILAAFRLTSGDIITRYVSIQKLPYLNLLK